MLTKLGDSGGSCHCKGFVSVVLGAGGSKFGARAALLEIISGKWMWVSFPTTLSETRAKQTF